METSTNRGTGAAQAFVVDRLNADFAGSGLADVAIRVDPAWTGSQGDDVILVAGGHEFPVELDGGGVEQACAFAAFQLQSDAMGERNRPWPELVNSTGETVGVLIAPTEAPGVAIWELSGKPFCAVGHLQRAVEAAGLRIK